MDQSTLRSASVDSSPARSAAPKSPYIMRQIPDVFVGFDSSKSWHPGQANAAFDNPEQLPIRVLLHRWRCKIRGARIHPSPGVSGCMAVGAMTHSAFDAVKLVPFLDARLQIRWRQRNTLAAAPADQQVLYLCRENGFHMTWLLQCVEPYLSESQNHYRRSKREGNKSHENPPFHPAEEKISRKREGGPSTRPSPTGYVPALIAATWIVLVALSKVPVTFTFCPANCSGLFWSSSS